LFIVLFFYITHIERYLYIAKGEGTITITISMPMPIPIQFDILNANEDTWNKTMNIF